MKKLILYITIILFVVAANNALAIDLTKWKYCSKITFEDKVEKYARVDIIGQVYDAAKSDLSDIRIIDSSQQQVPYLLRKPKDTTEKQKFTPNVINRSTNNKNCSLVTLDFGKQTIKNSIEVETGGSNFRRAVKVEGSNDNITFLTLVEQAFVFAISNKEKSRFNDIDLPVNDYRYLRITVAPMATEQKSPVINEIRTFKCDKMLAERVPVEMLYVNHTEDEKKNLSIYEYDLGYRNLPISEIQLSIADVSFYRHVTIEGRNAATRKVKIDSEDNRERFREIEESWKSVTGGTIYRYISTEGKKHEKTALSISSNSGTYRYLKITIRNYDDRPLKLETTSAKMIPHYVIFNATSDLEARLYVGSESAVKPKYDIRHTLLDKPSEVKAVVKATTAKLGSIAENSLFGKVEQKPQPWTERHKVLLLIVMAAVVLALGGFILKSFKSIQTSSES